MHDAAILGGEVNLVDRLLAEQRTLTAVERFARRHAEGAVPAQARYYRDLIPLSKPGPGQQYAFAVDLDACTGCKACVSACHSLNGLEEHETWRDTGLLIGERNGRPYQQTVTTACHHCADPACLEGCPVMAYEKDADTGIVRHLDDQCIGCQYCTLKCPYDVPKYSERLGIVRKCDMCHERLAAGEAPACVQACPHEAIAIRLVDLEEVSAEARPGTRLLPGAFDSSYTKPTTRYHARTSPPGNAEPADAHRLRLEHAHAPLLVMLVLTQMAAGLFAAAWGASFVEAGKHAFLLSAAGFAFLNAGLFAAVFHLGRPLGAWRFFLGLRTSWMSREILAFSLTAAAAGPAAGAAFLWPGTSFASASLGLTAVLGLLSVFTSAMIYVDTRRALWRSAQSFPRFYGATLVLGSSSAALLLTAAGAPVFPAIVLAALSRVGFFAWESATFCSAARNPNAENHLSACIVLRLAGWQIPLRIGSFAAALLGYACAISSGNPAPWLALAWLASLVGQLAERQEYFTAVRAPHMPGGLE